MKLWRNMTYFLLVIIEELASEYTDKENNYIFKRRVIRIIVYVMT